MKRMGHRFHKKYSAVIKRQGNGFPARPSCASDVNFCLKRWDYFAYIHVIDILKYGRLSFIKLILLYVYCSPEYLLFLQYLIRPLFINLIS
jgi:hypothetical protein